MSDNFLTKLFNPSKKGKIRWVIVGVVLLTLVGSLIDAGAYYNKAVDKYNLSLPKTKEIPFHLGLDLQGGTHLVYKAKVEETANDDKASAVEGARDVIERRVNVFGVSEPIITTNLTAKGEHRIIVELAGVNDVNEAIEMIGETPLLEFKEQSAEVRELTDEEKQVMEETNAEASEKAEEVLGKLLSGGDFAELAKEYSQDQNTAPNGGVVGWINNEESPQLASYAKDMEVGEESRELIEIPQGYLLLKLNEKRSAGDPFTGETDKEVKASHILICHNESEDCESDLSKEEALAKIKEIKEEATPENFSELAKEYSNEPGAETSGGSLGWFGKGKMVEPFEVTVFDQEVNTISYVVETKFGYHIILKEDEKDEEEYNISQIFIPTLTEADIVGSGGVEWKKTELTGEYLDRAQTVQNTIDGTYQVSLEFNSEGRGLFADITERNIGKRLAIFLDGGLVSAPNVKERINGNATIQGDFNIQEAKELAQSLNAGALPVPIELISQKTVGASLGHKSVTESLKAGLAGLLLVAVFMIMFYRLPGILSVISLSIYGVLVLAIFKLIPVTLSLSGLAGFILSIGMAVDANVLIFERLKEEIGAGKPLDKAIEDGFKRAWTSIRDGNISTIITCIILVFFTTSVVKGFAITLMLGVVISMFSAIVITKYLLLFVSGKWLENNKWLIGVKKNN